MFPAGDGESRLFLLNHALLHGAPTASRDFIMNVFILRVSSSL